MDLSWKIQTSMAKIMEYYHHFDGQVYVAFSGGKDSTVLLHIVRQIYPEIPAVFVDTGLE
jgi:3'-phosphoadenosine 5'-phosphosulfate sulfotransferase (PAPS reductase)/FAD synthetase